MKAKLKLRGFSNGGTRTPTGALEYCRGYSENVKNKERNKLTFIKNVTLSQWSKLTSVNKEKGESVKNKKHPETPKCRQFEEEYI